MIVWGSYVMRKKLRAGDFYCPHCTETRPFIHKRPRRWGHLYWIPLIPMETYDSYVECQACKKAFHEGAIDHDPRRDRAEKLAAIATMIGQIMMHVAHARRTEIAVPAIEAGIRDVLEIERIPPETQAEIATPLDRAAMLDRVREHGDSLVARVQEKALRVAMGPGAPTPEVRTLVGEIGAAMGMTAAHVAGLLAETASPARPGPAAAAPEARA